MWIRVEHDDTQVASLVTSPLLYVGCSPKPEDSVHNLVTLHPNKLGDVSIRHVTIEDGGASTTATRGGSIVAITTSTSPITVETSSPHRLSKGDTVRMVALYNMPLLDGKTYQIGNVVSNKIFELDSFDASTLGGSIGTYSQKESRWTGRVLSDMSTVQVQVTHTKPGPPSMEAVEGIFPSGHVTISWNPPTIGVEGSPLPCKDGATIDGYVIVRNDGARHGGRGYRTTSFVDYKVSPGQTYTYVVHAVCSDGIIGIGSDELECKTGPGSGTLGQPTKPRFSILETTGGAMRVGWDEPKSQGSKALAYDDAGGAFRVSYTDNLGTFSDVTDDDTIAINTEIGFNAANEYGLKYSKWVYGMGQWRDSDVTAYAVGLICYLTLTQLLLNTYTNFFILLFIHLFYTTAIKYV